MRRSQQRKTTREIKRFEKDEMQGIAKRFINELDEQLSEKHQQRDELEKRVTELEGRIYALVTGREHTPHEIEQYFVITMEREKEEVKTSLAKLRSEIFSFESAKDRVRYLMELRGYWNVKEN